MDTSRELVVRVVAGGVRPEEMAAVVAVLLSEAAGGGGREAGQDTAPRPWRWRPPAAFLPPHSWQAG